MLPYDDCKIDIQIRSRLAINMAIILQKNSTNSVGEHSVLPQQRKVTLPLIDSGSTRANVFATQYVAFKVAICLRFH